MKVILTLEDANSFFLQPFSVPIVTNSWCVKEVGCTQRATRTGLSASQMFRGFPGMWADSDFII